MADLKERMLKFGLELHPEKTRILGFGPWARRFWAILGCTWTADHFQEQINAFSHFQDHGNIFLSF